MSKEAMKQALEALEEPKEHIYKHKRLEAIHALRQALANEALDRMAENERELGIQMQPDEPVAWANINKQGDITHTQNKKGAWAKTPLYTRPQPAAHPDEFKCPYCYEQPADDPAAWLVRWNDDGAERTSVRLTKPDGEWSMDRLLPLYTRPLNSVNSIKSSNTLDAQPAAWVGLTDEDIALFDWESFKTKKDCSRAIEQALKEKNT